MARKKNCLTGLPSCDPQKGKMMVEKIIIGFLAIVAFITVVAYAMAVREHRIEKRKSQGKW
jgi:hypothetical protein